MKGAGIIPREVLEPEKEWDSGDRNRGWLVLNYTKILSKIISQQSCSPRTREYKILSHESPHCPRGLASPGCFHSLLQENRE